MNDSPSYFIKDPQAILDYTVDWTQWMASGDTISTVDWSVPPGIVQTTASTTSLMATVWLASGTVGQSYAIRCRMTTTAGRRDDRTFSVIVREK